MEYYVRELLPKESVKEKEKHAGGKARKDIGELFESEGMRPIDFLVNNEKRRDAGLFAKIQYHIDAFDQWMKKTKPLKKNDTLYIQFPIENHFIFQGLFFYYLKRKGVRINFFIHDLLILREMLKDDRSKKERIRLWVEEKLSLKLCSTMVVHNDRMANYLRRMKMNPKKIIKLQIFDYLIPDWDSKRASARALDRKLPVMIAGNLDRGKAKYVYHLPDRCDFRLYGIHYDGVIDESKQYMGSFMPEELPYEMEGSFGLVWDGESSETCSGVYGKYLQINNPHKISLYLASGIPIVIWEKAALADFVKRQGVGITVTSLYDLNDKLASVTEEEYQKMLLQIQKLSGKLRSGYFTKRAIRLCREKEKI